MSSDYKGGDEKDEYMEDDGRMIPIGDHDDDDYAIGQRQNGAEAKGSSSSAAAASSSTAAPKRRGVTLDLSSTAAAGSKDEKGGSDDNVQENTVLVIFDLPDGSQGESTFKLGQTVEVLKSYVESEFHIPMADQNLFIENKVMMNPLSLLDYPEAKGVTEIYIRVDGPLPLESKK